MNLVIVIAVFVGLISVFVLVWSIGLIPMNEIDSVSIETNSSDSLNNTESTIKNDDWKKIVAPEIYDEAGKILKKYDETVWKVYVENIPVYSHSSITNQVVDDALRSWKEVNPDFEFVFVDHVKYSNIDIKWVTNTNDISPTADIIIRPVYENPKSIHTMGITYIITTQYGDSKINHYEILVDLLDVDCNGNTIFWDKETVTDTIKHEIGHVFGIGHSSDENHLMYDPYDGVEKIRLDELIVPQKISNDYYIGEKKVVEEMKNLEENYVKNLGYYGWTVDDWEQGRVSGDQTFYERINSIIDRLNPLIDKSNCFALSTNP